MAETLYHGSSANIKKKLKPMGYARHIESNGLYLTESVQLAIGYAMGADWNKFDSIDVYNFEKQDWDNFFVLRSKKVFLGYVYESETADKQLVAYYDEKTNSPLDKEKYEPGAKAVFVSKKESEISAKHVVNYDFMSQNLHFNKVFALKKGVHFKKAIEKINQAAKKTETKDKKEFDAAMKNLNAVLDRYTDR